ncbi:MAG: molecular chaperone DnaJ, partial [Synechococcus sp. ArSW.bin.68]
ALSTIGLFISQVKRGRSPLGALGWSLALVALGLVLGTVIGALFATQAGLPFDSILLEAIPAYLVVLAGILLLL